MVVEYKPFSTEIRESIKYRVQALAIRMAQLFKPDAFSFLTCSAYYLDSSPEFLRYTLIYEYPQGADLSRKPVSLFTVLSGSTKIFPLPSLEQRYKLAQTLALSRLSLILIEYVHKGLRPQNVLLFYTPSAKGKSSRL